MEIPFLEKTVTIKKWFQFPEINIDKKIRISLITFVAIYMIINTFYGQASVHNNVKCFEDLTHKFTKNINNYFLIHTKYNFFIKLILSILIDLTIIYTLIVWSIYSSNIRFISSFISYIIINILIKFIYIKFFLFL